ESADAFTNRFLSGGKLGSVVLVRIQDNRRLYGSQYEGVSDVASAGFAEERGGPWTFHPVYSTPPLGTCTVTSSRGALRENSFPSTVRALNAGPSLGVVASGQTFAMLPAWRNPSRYIKSLGIQLPGLA